MPAYNARVALESHDLGMGALTVNVLHLEVDTLTSPPNWQSIADDIGAWLAVPYQNLLSQADQFDQIVVTDENYPGSTFGQGVHPVALNGTRTTGDGKLGRGLCALVSLKTAVAKRYARGHMFAPPAWDSTSLSAGGTIALSSAYHVTLEAFRAAWAAGHTAGSTSYVPIVFSRTRVQQAATPFTFPVRTMTIDTKQHYLRSRMTAP